VRLYVGITDTDWYQQLASAKPDEVNFWKPGEQGSFSVLNPGELFLFKLHAPHNFIVGGGHFVKFSKLPVSLSWLAFGDKNGVKSQADFISRVRKYRKAPCGPDPVIGNIILTEPFWFDRQDWIPTPTDWPKSTVQGKSFDIEDSRGYDIWLQIQERLNQPTDRLTVQEAVARYRQANTRIRLGQGGFRVTVTDAYKRRCAVTGENTLDVLEAAHIQPYSDNGPHSIQNGLLLRSDMHILFDKGLISVSPELKIEVSSHIREMYSNGKLYYSYQGSSLRSKPESDQDCPSATYLDWHNKHVFQP
jgi:putative restriction endonuclease